MTSNSETSPGNTRWLGTAATAVWNAFRETILEHPVALERGLQAPGATQFQLEPRQSVSRNELMRWDVWLDDLVEHGCPADRGVFHRYGPLTYRHTQAAFACTIRDIEGLLNSKSRLEDYQDLDVMAVQTTDVAEDPSMAKLHANLAWTGLGREPTIDRGDFSRYLWDGRIFWNNPDGSHHFAAARYLARTLSVEIALKPRPLNIVAIDEAKLRVLLADWELFAMHDIFDRNVAVNDPSSQNMPSLHECLRSAQVPHSWVCLPRPYAGEAISIAGIARMPTGTFEANERARKESKTALFLPRHEPRAQRAAALLRQANAFDLGAYLISLAERQRRFAR